MKNSGVAWIGDIPAHWEVKRVKGLYSNLGGGNYGEPEENGGAVLPCISISDFKHGDIENTNLIKLSRSYQKTNTLYSNTILIEQLDMQLACASTTSGKILEQAKKSENTGVFFLDICLQSEMTGLILAQELRKIQPRCFIIFITSHSEMSILTFQYKVEALDFIIKDSSENIRKRIHECLMDINKKILTVNKKQQKK